MDRYDRMAEAEKVLDEHGISAEVYQFFDLPVTCVEIHWGDWKHEHLYADYILEQAGFDKMGERLTEEDGSDTYSAIHFYA